MGAIAVGRVERHPRESLPNMSRNNTLTIPPQHLSAYLSSSQKFIQYPVEKLPIYAVTPSLHHTP